MNTSAIKSPLAVMNPAANNSKQEASSLDAGAFNQLLTREIAGRNNSNSNSNNVSNNANNTINSVNKNAQKDAYAKGEKSTNNASDGAANTQSSEASKSTDTTKSADSKDADAVVDGPTAELLAFVSVLTQANSATPVTDVASKATASADITDVDAKLDTTLGIGASASSDKDAIGKQSDFVAALDKASTTAGDGKASTIKPAADLAAAVTTVVPKTTEAISATNAQVIAAAGTLAVQQLAGTEAVQSNKLAPQVGTPDWNQSLGQKVVWMVQGAQQTATLTLNPPDLGPMQVTLNVSNNQATANFTAHQPDVRHALEAAMPRLREMLNDAGIQLGQSSVSAGTQQQQNAFNEQQQSGRQSGNSNNAAEPVTHVSHVSVPIVGNGIVDTFA